MTNELIFTIIAILDFFCILVVARLGKSWLVATVILNILLISVFGAKLISVFGFATNSGNVFYAAVFFATQLLVEHYGREEGYRCIWVGVLSTIFFILMSQLIVLTSGLTASSNVNAAVEVLFATAPRIAFASLSAFIFSQLVNIRVFDYLKRRSGGKRPYIRVNMSNFAGQLVDSVIFFMIAFYGLLPFDVLFQTLIVGFLLKVVVGALSTPFFYLSLAFGKGEI